MILLGRVNFREKTSFWQQYYRDESPMLEKKEKDCSWILVQEWLTNIPNLLTNLEMEKGLTLLVRNQADYENEIQFPDIMLSPGVGIFIICKPMSRNQIY